MNANLIQFTLLWETVSVVFHDKRTSLFGVCLNNIFENLL